MKKFISAAIAAVVSASVVLTTAVFASAASAADPVGTDEFKVWSNFNQYSPDQPFMANQGFTCYHNYEDYDDGWVPEIVTDGLNGSNALAINLTSYNQGDELFFERITALGDANDFTGATDFWAYIEMPETPVAGLYFGFRNVMYDGKDFTFRISDSKYVPVPEDQRGTYYTQDADGNWVENKLDEWNTIPSSISGYKGFIRIPYSNFHDKLNSTAANKQLGLNEINILYVGIQPATIPDTDQKYDYTGERVLIDQVGFSGPAVEGSQGTVAQLMAGEDFVKAPAEKYDFSKNMYTAFDFEDAIFTEGSVIGAEGDLGKIISANPGPKDDNFDLLIKKVNGSKGVGLESFTTDMNTAIELKTLKSPLGRNFLPEGVKGISAKATKSGVILYADFTEYYRKKNNPLFIQFEEYDYNPDGTVRKELVENDEGEMEEKTAVTRRGIKVGAPVYFQDADGNFTVVRPADGNSAVVPPREYAGYIAIPYSSLETIWDTIDADGMVNLQTVLNMNIYTSGYEDGEAVSFDNVGFFYTEDKNEPEPEPTPNPTPNPDPSDSSNGGTDNSNADNNNSNGGTDNNGGNGIDGGNGGNGGGSNNNPNTGAAGIAGTVALAAVSGLVAFGASSKLLKSKKRK